MDHDKWFLRGMLLGCVVISVPWLIGSVFYYRSVRPKIDLYKLLKSNHCSTQKQWWSDSLDRNAHSKVQLGCDGDMRITIDVPPGWRPYE